MWTYAVSITKLFLLTSVVIALLLAIACGAKEEPTPAAGMAAPTEADAPAETSAPVEPTTTPVQPATPTPTPLPEATSTPIATVAPVKEGVGVWGGDARFLTTEYPELWDPHLEGTIVGLEGTSPLYNQVVEFNPISPDEIIGDLAKSWVVSDDGMTYTFTIHATSNGRTGKT